MAAMHTKEGLISQDSKGKFNPKEHVEEELVAVEGSWINYLDIAGKRLFNGL